MVKVRAVGYDFDTATAEDLVKKIEDEIQVLKKEKSSEQLSEKRKIKAEMAKIEDEEHEKLIALKERSWLNPNLSHTAVRPGSGTAWPMLGLRPCFLRK